MADIKRYGKDNAVSWKVAFEFDRKFPHHEEHENQRPPAELGVGGGSLEGAGTIR